MTDYREIYNTNTRNWFKCALALHITKAGIVNYVEREIHQFHEKSLKAVTAAIPLPAGSTCNSCTTQSVIVCPTKGYCDIRKGGCVYHKGSQTLCTTGICTGLAETIKSEHRYRKPSWKNVDVSKWCFSAWELAKCYLPPDGYINVSSAKETDFNGLISILENCLLFDGQCSSDQKAVYEKVC